MNLRRARWGLVALVAAAAACFDSDEKFSPQVGTTTGDTTTTTDPSTTTTTDPTTSTETTTGSDQTCRDAIDCIFQCAAAIQAQLQINPDFEPDLSCFLECEEQLPVPEAYKLIKLGNCAADECAAMGQCGSEDTTGGSDSGGDEGPPPGIGGLDPCISCIFTIMLDEEYPGCAEFALACE